MTSPIAAHRCLGRVGSYGLARVDRGLQLHRLTQAVLRDQLGVEDATAYRCYGQALLVAADPGDRRDPTRWPGWARILPHLLAADPATSSSPDLRDLACHAAWHLYYRSDIHLARDLTEHLHRQWSERLGPDHQQTLRAAHALVLVLATVGPYRRASQLVEDTLTRGRRVLGDESYFAMDVANNLATFLQALGEGETARQLSEDTLTRARRVFGDDHPRTRKAADNLAAAQRLLSGDSAPVDES